MMGPLDLVPHFMRSWPFLRRFYWQQEQLDEMWRRALIASEELQQYVQGPLMIVPPRKPRDG